MENTYQEKANEWIRMRMCTRKQYSFRDKRRAKDMARDLNRLERNKTNKVRPYKCRFCENYHVGHNKYLHDIPQRG